MIRRGGAKGVEGGNGQLSQRQGEKGEREGRTEGKTVGTQCKGNGMREAV